LSGNRIQGTIPESYSRPPLRDLYLDGNMLSGTIPAAVIGMPFMVQLYDATMLKLCVPQCQIESLMLLSTGTETLHTINSVAQFQQQSAMPNE
jgi:hypothetical protein